MKRCTEGTRHLQRLDSTWWINLDAQKEWGPTSACVVNAAKKQAEINWMSMGVLEKDAAWIEDAVKSLDTDPITLEAFQAGVA